MNAARDVARNPELAVQPGQLNAMGLIDEILHHVSALYRQRRDPQALEAALAGPGCGPRGRGGGRHPGGVRRPLSRRPPCTAGGVSAGTWLAGDTDGLPNRQVALEELAQLWLANVNPAFEPFHELFDDRPLAAESAYEQVIEALAAHFAARPPFGPENQTLVAMLRSPAIASPDSLSGQLRYIRERWGLLLEGLLDGRLALSLDVLSEEERALWLRFHGWDEAAALARGQRVGVYQFGDQELEPERFSLDRDWMPRLVLIAKSTYVWLDQLARAVPARDPAPRPDPRRGAGPAGAVGVHRALADRAVGAQPGLAADQAAAGQPGRRGLGLLAARLPDRRRPGRRGGLREPARARLAARHPAGERHGAEPHGHRLGVGHRAPRLVRLPRRPAVPRLLVRRTGPLARTGASGS